MHETLAVETETRPRRSKICPRRDRDETFLVRDEAETETFLNRDETETRRREDVHGAGLGAGELLGLRSGPAHVGTPRLSLRGPHPVGGKRQRLRAGAVGWGEETAPWGPGK